LLSKRPGNAEGGGGAGRLPTRLTYRGCELDAQSLTNLSPGLVAVRRRTGSWRCSIHSFRKPELFDTAKTSSRHSPIGFQHGLSQRINDIRLQPAELSCTC